ncbi:lipase family protein [Pseudomonadota bacterium]
MDQIQIINDILELITNNPILSSIISLAATGTIGTGIFSFLRRPRPSDTKTDSYFESSYLLTPPTKRPAYSDRMAYVLAELSDLAYFEFEGPGGAILDAIDHVKKINKNNDDDIKKFLESFAQGLMGSRNLNIGFLNKTLEASGFKLIDTINVGKTQGFACKRIKTGETPYVVIAFRGTENKISDWLTDADAIPTTIGNTKVHTGFHKAFNEIHDQQGMSVKNKITEIMNNPEVKDNNGVALPLFITGHSLGGALALIATNTLASDIIGACYTFGAPRVANYEYFNNLKTPVYRVVNSSDIVPRVPPGAFMVVIIKLVKLMSWLTKLVPVISTTLYKFECFLDKLNGYRHVGDMRYLTDIANKKYNTVKLLSNPPAIDRIMWMWQHLAASMFFPVSSHSMKIYRKKLLYVANSRNSSD